VETFKDNGIFGLRLEMGEKFPGVSRVRAKGADFFTGEAPWATTLYRPLRASGRLQRPGSCLPP
jgi:hypothetical protein